MNDAEFDDILERCLSSPDNLSWFCRTSGSAAQNGRDGAKEFLARAATSDISPFRFFDAEWFRSRYAVAGPNAFLSYLRNQRQRLALPSAVFAPRWYCRQYVLKPTVHPLLDFLQHGDQRNPHPLIDIEFLRSQTGNPGARGIALNYLIDPDKFRLKPHPLFDGGWYLDNNPDVAAARMHPLEHYLRFGYIENRNPNWIFNTKWLKQSGLPRQHRSRIEPLTRYASLGFARGRTPAPGLQALAKPTVELTAHGPKLLVDSIRDRKSVYAALRHRPALPPNYREFLTGRVQDYNPAFPEHILVLSEKRLALMYTAKCASAKLVYWWQEQSKMLDVALRFTAWSHSFENLYRESRRHFEEALTFNPSKYRIYKFVRHPSLRAVSSYTHFLLLPEFFGVSSDLKGISFMNFLDLMQTSNFLGNEIHFRPQLSAAEKSGLVVPELLKLEDGLDGHLRSIERLFDLPEAKFQQNPEIRKLLASHAKQKSRNVFSDPYKLVPFMRTPDASSLLTKDSKKRIYELYAADFEAYGYVADM